MLQKSDRRVFAAVGVPDPKDSLIVAIQVLKAIAFVLVASLSDQLLKGLVEIWILFGIC